MAKFALLIGVSEYEPGLAPLPAAIRDVEAMQRVLQHPEIGHFDEVKKLVNPQKQAMAEAIEHLFNARQKDDLILLFFSGHGIKDESGKLYFATHNTRKTNDGSLFKATTVAARDVHDVMSNSRSKREVVILDCCFSGAFAEGMSAKDNGFVDVKNQLGGEGRAVLTSSTSTQYSFEDIGSDTSTYTRYVVEGLETGAADKDQDGWITVDELHEYAARKVQEAAPAMKPEIYAIKEGYKINLAKAPNDHPHLKYRREVEYWVEGGNGEISSIGRAVLEELKNELKLTNEEANKIETQVLAPMEIYKDKLHKYEEALRKEIEACFPLSDKIRSDLHRLQQVLGLTDEACDQIEARIIVEKKAPPCPEDNIPIFQNGHIWNYLVVGIVGIIIGITLGAMFRPQSVSKSCPVLEEYITGDRISVGEEILLTQDTNPDKQAGVQAFAKGDCRTAIQKFESYRKIKPTDPEALIYLNNAIAIHSKKYLKIAVSVPIGTHPNIAKEMLRGVAQAQDEVNQNNIDGKLLKVAIANDDNNPTEALNLANSFVEDTNILAVVGHNSSNASNSAASVYEQGGLVMMSPTSYAQDISSIGNYIFRTAPSIESITESVALYAIKKMNKNNFLICVDQNVDNGAVKNNFTQIVKKTGGTINPIGCNFSSSKLSPRFDPNFNPSTIISQAQNSGADSLLLAHYVDKSRDTTRQGLAVVKANQGQLSLFGTPAIFTGESLQEGKYINGIIISVPWHSQAVPNDPFEQKSRKLWGGPVNWRTATSYDATKAIIAGLQKTNTLEGNTRERLKQSLRDSDFAIDGATGKIQFSPSGDRVDNPMFLVQIQQKPGTNNYEFVPIKD
ncbi:caspase, EACC1-associated type [Nodularia sp. NIES-3585]|uniref:caspase, EACC1-associated type n=1 Tax=Nodularia sp. NIES-3585 TaxID=1973477 RepID=UPI000B5C6865|nr:ABC transporter substrate-binding protein [Nodularia sp. NIES-3585]GAX38212.1 extracellular ligand-binding receptor [Nodularia sp. NIES-3585]